MTPVITTQAHSCTSTDRDLRRSSLESLNDIPRRVLAAQSQRHGSGFFEPPSFHHNRANSFASTSTIWPGQPMPVGSSIVHRSHANEIFQRSDDSRVGHQFQPGCPMEVILARYLASTCAVAGVCGFWDVNLDVGNVFLFLGASPASVCTFPFSPLLILLFKNEASVWLTEALRPQAPDTRSGAVRMSLL